MKRIYVQAIQLEKKYICTHTVKFELAFTKLLSLVHIAIVISIHHESIKRS